MKTMAKTDYSYFIGNWKNSHATSKGIGAFEISEGANGPQIKVSGIETGYFPGDWGSKPVSFLVNGPDQTTASAFSASFEVGGRSLFLAANINKGLIIIAIYGQAPAGSEVPSLFTREFYYKK
jgi:hypothetical protein